MSNKAAAELGRLRWRGTTKEERREVSRALNEARSKKLTPEERSELARNAARALWEKRRARQAGKTAGQKAGGKGGKPTTGNPLGRRTA